MGKLIDFFSPLAHSRGGSLLDEKRKSMPVARAVEAVRAEVALGQTDGVHHALQGIELQRVHADVFAEHLDEVGILLAVGVAVLFDVLVVVAFQGTPPQNNAYSHQKTYHA